MTIRKYLEDTPRADEIKTVQALLSVPLIRMMRPKDARFRELGLLASDDEATLLAAMVDNPILIERPIVLANGKAAIGRPPDAVLEIL